MEVKELLVLACLKELLVLARSVPWCAHSDRSCSGSSHETTRGGQDACTRGDGGRWEGDHTCSGSSHETTRGSTSSGSGSHARWCDRWRSASRPTEALRPAASDASITYIWKGTDALSTW